MGGACTWTMSFGEMLVVRRPDPWPRVELDVGLSGMSCAYCDMDISLLVMLRGVLGDLGVRGVVGVRGRMNIEGRTLSNLMAARRRRRMQRKKARAARRIAPPSPPTTPAMTLGFAPLDLK